MASDDRNLVKSLGKVGAVFFRSFPTLRPSQRAAIPPVLAGESILLACPTASGKTEAIFAPLIAAIRNRSVAAPGVRLLAIAPTRALVNDLYARLAPALDELGLECGRQTSDHRLGKRLPFLVITTPESFDSLLARRSLYGLDGRPNGHVLDGVDAVFIDEAHLFDNTARGDQLLWLLARLKRVKRGASGQTGGLPTIQICAASATVSSPAALANRLLGPLAEVVSVAGDREIFLYNDGAIEPWPPIGSADSLDSLLERVSLVKDDDSLAVISDLVWRAMACEGGQVVRKVLIFVASRGLCDELSTALKEHLRLRRQVAVFAHHGSLDKAVREAAESNFGSSRDSVLVATSTLEVGVDIGDVDAVVLIGPPNDSNGLLQRIGRSGRRQGITRVLAIARSPVDRFALASMLAAARHGLCDPIRYGRRWSVCVQQISSFVKQGPSAGRRISDIADLADEVWPVADAQYARQIVDHLIQENLLTLERDHRVGFGDAWQTNWDGMGMHANIDGAAGGRPVIDAVTGETLAHIPASGRVPDQISLAGANWRVTEANGEILLQGMKATGARGSIRYGSRKAPVSRAFARHVGLGLGFTEYALVRVQYGGEQYVFHFGGSIFERVIVGLNIGLHSAAGLGGIATRGPLTAATFAACSDARRVEGVLTNCLQGSPGLVAAGPFHRFLPIEVQALTLKELVSARDFKEWIDSRHITEVEAGSYAAARLHEILETST